MTSFLSAIYYPSYTCRATVALLPHRRMRTLINVILLKGLRHCALHKEVSEVHIYNIPIMPGGNSCADKHCRRVISFGHLCAARHVSGLSVHCPEGCHASSSGQFFLSRSVQRPTRLPFAPYHMSENSTRHVCHSRYKPMPQASRGRTGHMRQPSRRVYTLDFSTWPGGIDNLSSRPLSTKALELCLDACKCKLK